MEVEEMATFKYTNKRRREIGGHAGVRGSEVIALSAFDRSPMLRWSEWEACLDALDRSPVLRSFLPHVPVVYESQGDMQRTMRMIGECDDLMIPSAVLIRTFCAVIVAEFWLTTDTQPRKMEGTRCIMLHA